MTLSMGPGASMGAWWGYAEGNRTLVGAVAVLVALAAIGFVLRALIVGRQHRRGGMRRP